jgi:hypothetical protein
MGGTHPTLPNRAWAQAGAGKGLETRLDVSRLLVCFFYIYFLYTYDFNYSFFELFFTCRLPPRSVQPYRTEHGRE